MKKRGFGAGHWNGVGGKVAEGETADTSAIREIEEEIGVTVSPEDLESVGALAFRHEDKPDWNMHAYIFVVRRWNGEPKESEEMRPQWYMHHELPFHDMWPDDSHWLPKVLNGKKVEGEFLFTNNGSEIVKFEVREQD